MPTAGTSVIDQANAEQADTVTSAADEHLVRFWWRGVAILPPMAFDLEEGPTDVSKGRDNIVGGEIPSVTVLS